MKGARIGGCQIQRVPDLEGVLILEGARIRVVASSGAGEPAFRVVPRQTADRKGFI